AGIPLRSADRRESDPIVMGGGPLAFNPEPLADFFDAILIGEGEEAVVEIVEAHRGAKEAGLARADMLAALARVPGVYVPSLYEPADATHPARPVPGSGAPAVVCKRVVADFDAMRSPVCPIVPFMDVVHDRANIEVLRGCTRGCRFCQAGMIYRPVRERSADTIVRDALAQLACSGQEELSLSSLSTTDHSAIEEVLRRLSAALAGRAVNVGLPSLRVDSFGVAMARLVGEGARGGLTFAPEAGTQRLRDVINKNVTEEDLLVTVRTAFDAGWRRLKLYFMLGLPTETDDDIRGIGALVNKVLVVARDVTPPAQRGGMRIAVSVSTFVPKSHTPFQWEPQLTLEEVRHRQQVLRESMPRKGVELHWHDAEVSFVEGALARGGRELADVIEHAWRAGGGFDAWTERFRLSTWREAFDAAGVDPVALASTARIVGSPLPWNHISSGVDETYLADERERALSATLTPDCSFEGCTDCGVCPTLGVDVVLAGGHRG
ncbi:MAG TPA: TIGR03960 family B12-binding radical SAM protein, partial [Coriobacteriia bacterium]